MNHKLTAPMVILHITFVLELGLRAPWHGARQ